MPTFADWCRDHAAILATLDRDAPLDGLEPLREFVGNARIVAIGENAHFIREFTHARLRILRFLAERCGFTVFAYEFGFSEAFRVDQWIQGSGEDDGLAQVSETAETWGAGDLLRFLRRLNRRLDRPVRFAGVDIPEAGGSLLPALDPVAHYLHRVDPDSVPFLETAREIAALFAGKSGATSAPAWARLDPARQDALTAALSRLLLRFRALEPLLVRRSDQTSYDIALRRLEAASHADYMLRAMAGLFAGNGWPGDLSVRDQFMAESVRWHLERAGPEARIVLAAHNNHIQKTPVIFGDRLTSLPMGQHLHRMWGADYVALALTSTADHTAEMSLDPTAPAGFTVADTPLEAPASGSMEAAIVEAGLGREISLVDLRRMPGGIADRGEIDRIRTQSAYMHTRIPEAFDGVLTIPSVTIENVFKHDGPSTPVR